MPDPAEPTRPASEATFTIRPRRRSCMPGNTACVTAITPRKFTPSTRSHIASSVFTKKPNSSYPALFTRMSIEPSSSVAAATAAAIESPSRTSSSYETPFTSDATSPAPETFMSVTATRAPSPASRLHVAATFAVMDALERADRPAWSRLGDRDLAMCLVRSERLNAGERLTLAHAEVCRALDLEVDVIPMSDDPVRTQVKLGGRWLPFQEF